jgi:DNA-binding transcriptional ArsR family regulator
VKVNNPAVVMGHRMNVGRRIVRMSSVVMGQLLRALFDRPRTYRELRIITGMSETTLRDHMRELRRVRLVRITDYLPNTRGQRRIMQFQWAPDQDSAVLPRRNQENHPCAIPQKH